MIDVVERDCDDVSSVVVESVAAAVDDEGDDVNTDFTNCSDLLFFTGGGSSVSWQHLIDSMEI